MTGEIIEQTTKQCRRCKTDKHPAEFNKNQRTRDGLQDWCRPCQRDYQQAKKARAV